MSHDDPRRRYDRFATMTRLPLLLAGQTVAFEGKRATVVEARERDDERYFVILDFGDGGKHLHLSGAPAAILPVFTDPYPVCACHGDPWPCNDAHAAEQAKRAERAARNRDLAACQSCGNTRNLGPHRYLAGERRRYCKRKACQAEFARIEREWRELKQAERREREAFDRHMREAMS